MNEIHTNPVNASFAWDGLHFSGGVPGLQLLLGPEETPWNWSGTPDQPASRRRRLTPLGEGVESVVQWHTPENYRVEWRITELSNFKGFSLRTIFTNFTAGPVRLRKLGILKSSSSALRLDGGDWFVSSSIGGWQDPPAGNLSAARPSVRRFRDFAAIYSQMGERGVFMAAVGPAESDVGIEFFNKADGYDLSIFSEMTDIVVDSGESRTSEEVVFLFASYQAAAESAMRWLAATHGSRVHRGAFTGWCSWYEQYTDISAAHVIDVATALKEHRSTIPHAVIQIDEGYEKAWGDWRVNSKFPKGWAPVTQAIRDAGATPGVWIAPLGVYDSLQLHRDHPEWFQFSASGCEPAGTNFLGNPLHFLDPTHPEVQQMIRKNLRAAMAEGFRYFKIDFNIIESCRFFDKKTTRFQAFRNLYRLYREEVGEESYLNACCSGLKRAPIGFVDAMRISADSDYQWSWILLAIRGTAETCPANGILMTADPDVFFTKLRPEASSPLTNSQIESWQGFVGLLGGLAMTSEPLHRSEYLSTFHELEILTPPVPERGRSFLPGMEVYPSLFGFIAERLWGDFAVVQVFNASDKVADVRLSAPDLDRFGKCHLWSFRDGKYLGVASGTHVEKNLPPWGSRLIRMTPVCGRPVLVGSDLHIGMGAAEIKAFSAGEDTLLIELHDAGARAGNLWIHSEQALLMESAQGCEARLQESGEHLWKLELSKRGRDSDQRIVLAVGRSIQERNTPEGANFEELSKLHVSLEFLGNPCLGEPASPGLLKVSLTHHGVGEISGDVGFLSNFPGSLRFDPANVPFRLSPGENMSCEIGVLPCLYKPSFTVAAVIQNSIRAWSLGSMCRAPIRVPSREEPPSRLSSIAQHTPQWILPNDPGVARLRMASSREVLYFEIEVEDSDPAPNFETLWEGACVEFFFAKSGTNDIRQFFCQPDLSEKRVLVFKAQGIGNRRTCAEVTTALMPTADGYRITACIPRSMAGIDSSDKEWLLEIQVSRHHDGRLEHIPLFGGPGAFASTQFYIRAIEENI